MHHWLRALLRLTDRPGLLVPVGMHCAKVSVYRHGHILAGLRVQTPRNE